MTSRILFLLCCGSLFAQTPKDLFLHEILPTLQRRCLACHGQTLASKLDLRSRDGLLRGGARGPAVVPGDAAKSLLIAAIEQSGDLKMPVGARLPAETIAAFRRWIDLGAPWVEGEPAWKSKPEDVWAFQPLKYEARGSLDTFILERLRAKGLPPARRADRLALIRRATFDLTGLPPTPEEVDAFVNDRSPDAFRSVVERLLASLRYGERWARRWLDVARYADSAGYSNDFERPNAWRYRDYVIRSFNQDKPYDQFIREQIAGDEMDPKDPEKLIATGFLRMGPWEHTAMSVAAVTRQAWLDDATHITSAAFLGLTMECARCHDHKFDPIPTRDYYRLQAVFATTEFADRPAPFLAGEQGPDFAPGQARERELIRRAEKHIDDFKQIVRRRLLEKHGAKDIGEIPADVVTKAERQMDLLTPEEFERLKVYRKRIELYTRSSKRYDPLAYSVTAGEKPADTFILTGGNLQSPGERVAPGSPSALPSVEIPQTPAGRRLALANWVANERNPLTARVMVNRIWQSHFGKGLVATSNNLGKMGKRPTHPELLDWLAGYFIEHGWSIKQMHRLIMLSDAYQRASQPADAAATARLDPDNDLLSYFSPRRLEAEEMRDSILAIAGELSLDTGGPGVFPEINQDVANQPLHIMGTLAPAWRPSPARRERNRRAIYTFQKRNLSDPFLEVLNGPPLNESCERRRPTTVPTQVFALFNSSFVHDMALALAARLETISADPRVRIDGAFRLVFQRLPTPEERRKVLTHLEDRTRYHQSVAAAPRGARKPLVRSITSELTGTEVPIAEEEDPVSYEENIRADQVSPRVRALADVALVLFNSNEMAYVY